MSNFHLSQLNIPLINKSYELYKLLYRYLKDFPKKERYTLGEKIEETLLEIIGKTIYLNQLPDHLKENQLLLLNSQNELLKLLIRLSYDVKILKEQQYLTLQSYLQEIGKMIGGWIKYLKR